MAKSLKSIMPSGSTYDPHTATFRWSKRGGHAGFKSVVGAIKKAEAVGFVRDGTSSGGSPDGNVTNSGSVYVHPEGHRLETDASYGVTAHDNRFSVKLTVVTKG